MMATKCLWQGVFVSIVPKISIPISPSFWMSLTSVLVRDVEEEPTSLSGKPLQLRLGMILLWVDCLLFRTSPWPSADGRTTGILNSRNVCHTSTIPQGLKSKCWDETQDEEYERADNIQQSEFYFLLYSRNLADWEKKHVNLYNPSDLPDIGGGVSNGESWADLHYKQKICHQHSTTSSI
jgi:hypothetical protein